MLGPEWTSGGQSGQGLCPRGSYRPDSGDLEIHQPACRVCEDEESVTPDSFNVSACQKVTLARAQLPRSTLLRSSGRVDKEGRIR